MPTKISCTHACSMKKEHQRTPYWWDDLPMLHVNYVLYQIFCHFKWRRRAMKYDNKMWSFKDVVTAQIPERVATFNNTLLTLESMEVKATRLELKFVIKSYWFDSYKKFWWLCFFLNLTKTFFRYPNKFNKKLIFQIFKNIKYWSIFSQKFTINFEFL